MIFMQLWLDRLQDSIEKLKIEEEYRELKKYTGLDFISNDYLGIATRGILQDISVTLIRDNIPLGSTGSRLLTGNTETHESAEAFFSNYFDCGDTLIANSGYDANVAVLTALTQRRDIILYDEKVHASIKEGMRLSFANRYSVKHNNWNDLENKVKKHRENGTQGNIFYVFETVYSMDGDIPDLKALVDLAQKYEIILIADEVHAFGVFGKKGEGLLQYLNLHKHVAVRIFGFGKAAGTYGAVIAVQDKVIKKYLLNTARAIIYTTALSPFQVEVMKTAVNLIEHNPDWRESLHKNMQTFQKLLPDTVIQSPILPIIVGNNKKLLHLFKEIQETGFDVGMIRSPTVPKGQERLRIIVHAFNKEEDIYSLTNLVKTLYG